MTIEGLQKLTLLDYPGRTACTVFLAGCNFRCPFCHNFELVVNPAAPLMTDEELLDYLQKRKGLLDGVAITGGEPLLRKELPELLRKVKALGYAVKLDTNGSFPARLKALVEEGLVDYVAMDVKNAPARYGETVGFLKLDLAAIQKSIDYLLTDAVDYEFRTTVVEQYHSAEEIRAIAEWIQGAKRYYLQQFKASERVPNEALSAPSYQKMQEYLQIASEIIPQTELRGVG
ncbi:MAG: anaerobic ribonucleoside-triphosphate reductase activating protein [Clostridia bacterium]|nr:anaerobic ribonucleoside-triphosphate reductase activating protein [Clostridia bacterium]